jgi:excisionase family DNA binding protein
MSEEPLLLRPDEAGTETGLSTSMIYRLISQRAIPFIKIGASVRIPRAALEAWIQQKLDEQQGQVGLEKTNGREPLLLAAVMEGSTSAHRRGS